MPQRICLLLCLLSSLTPAWAEEGEVSSCPMVRMVPERLPDLTVPRSGHCIFYANGELTVAGGHTTNFVPTPTAEYYADGEWHQLPMAYIHDNGFAAMLRSGEVIVGGGHVEPLGIGQSFVVERYMPASHTFEGFGCLDRRRVLANATQLSDGRVIIAGNHYAADAIACYDGRPQVQHLKSVVQGRSIPYILKTAKDNAIIIGPSDIRQCMHDTVWADRVEGAAFRVPLLERWKLLPTDQPYSSDACFIGDEQAGDYSYLLTATDAKGQLGIVMLRDTIFSLLPTVCPIPMQGPFGPVFYKGPVVTDRRARRGYVMAVDSLFNRQYVLAIDYAREPAALKLYYTDPIERATITIPIVTPDGDLILAGGIPNDNYKPLSAVWLYHFGTDETRQEAASHISFWLWAALPIIVLTFLAYLLFYLRRKVIRTANKPEQSDSVVSAEELMQRICQVIERDEGYRAVRLKLSDIAVELGVSATAVADCISSQRHCTFAQLIAEYRVRHVQRLLTENPELKLAAIITESGFSSESTFFRAFKTVTGLSPKEWLAQKTDTNAL